MSIFTQLGKSLYSPKDIASYRFQGIGRTIMYVFLLTLISIIPVTYYTAAGLKDAMVSVKETIDTKIPSFTIEDGELKSDLLEPLTIELENYTIIFDPTGTVQEQNMTSMDATFAMLKNEAVLAAGGQTNAFSYTLLSPDALSKEDVVKLVNSAVSSLPIFIGLLFIVIFVFSSGFKFIEVSILALFGLLLKNIAEKNLQYRHLWRMSAYSVTLTTLFFTIMGLLKTEVPYSYMVNWFVSSMVLLLAIKESPGKKKKV